MLPFAGVAAKFSSTVQQRYAAAVPVISSCTSNDYGYLQKITGKSFMIAQYGESFIVGRRLTIFLNYHCFYLLIARKNRAG